MLTVVGGRVYTLGTLLRAHELLDLLFLPLPRLHDLDLVRLRCPLFGQDQVLGATDPRHISEMHAGRETKFTLYANVSTINDHQDSNDYKCTQLSLFRDKITIEAGPLNVGPNFGSRYKMSRTQNYIFAAISYGP